MVQKVTSMGVSTQTQRRSAGTSPRGNVIYLATEILNELPPEKVSWRVWAVLIVLVLLFHGAFLRVQPGFLSTQAPRVQVQTIDPARLEEIRKKWQKEAARSKSDSQMPLLLDQDKTRKGEKEAPPNARYMSDKNIRVDHEQRAKQTNVVPKPRSKAQPFPKVAPRTAVPRVDAPKGRTLPKDMLGNLGVPFHLKPLKPRTAENAAQGRLQPQEEGGDQYVDDKKLPEGSENMLNAQESVYYSFFARLYETIGPLWQSEIRQVSNRRRVQPGNYTTIADVVLDPKGNILEVKTVESSGVEEFDSAVGLAWKRALKFPNPPPALVDSRGKIHTPWSFTVRVGEGFSLDYMPPERLE